MKQRIIFVFLFLIMLSINGTPLYAQKIPDIHLFPDTLTKAEIDEVIKEVENSNRSYDTAIHLVKAKAFKHYHSDLDETYTIHNILSSFNYAVALLDSYQPSNYQRAFEVLRTCLNLQDKDPNSKTFGVWPYFLEEPFATKKSPADRNWADFCSVRILRILNNHHSILPNDLKIACYQALMNACEEIKVRDIKPDYTNICLMGLHVCYMTAMMYNDQSLLTYSKNRLQHFYQCTLLNNGFIEYNSPAYTKLAMDEVWELKKNVTDPNEHAILDSIYNIGWRVVASHYHPTSAQWAGPHGRAYAIMANANIYNWLYTSSNGLIHPETQIKYSKTEDHILKHKIPKHLLGDFLNPIYPRLQIDTLIHANQPFEINPMVSYQANDTVRKLNIQNVIGKTYYTKDFVFSSVNKSSLWDQRRPILAYWGSARKPNYLRVRFLHDMNDYAAANVFCDQDSTTLLGAINFTKNGGDTHISIDAIKNATIRASDLRLRFEFGGNTEGISFDQFNSTKRAVVVNSNNMKFNIEVPVVKFDQFETSFTTGSDTSLKWVDLIIYHGEKVDFNFEKIQDAIIGFMISIMNNKTGDKPILISQFTNHYLTMGLNNLKLKVPTKPYTEPVSLLIK